jgi:hypothetical protein
MQNFPDEKFLEMNFVGKKRFYMYFKFYFQANKIQSLTLFFRGDQKTYFPEQ